MNIYHMRDHASKKWLRPRPGICQRERRLALFYFGLLCAAVAIILWR